MKVRYEAQGGTHGSGVAGSLCFSQCLHCHDVRGTHPFLCREISQTHAQHMPYFGTNMRSLPRPDLGLQFKNGLLYTSDGISFWL